MESQAEEVAPSEGMLKSRVYRSRVQRLIVEFQRIVAITRWNVFMFKFSLRVPYLSDSVHCLHAGPPGLPGADGKRGRKGEKGSPVSSPLMRFKHCSFDVANLFVKKNNTPIRHLFVAL
jgi:hypothetical protein